MKSFHCWNHFESLWSTTPISSLQHETQEREPPPSLVQLWINRDQTLSKRRCVNRMWSFRSNHHSLVGFKHSGVVVSWFGGEIASLPQLRGSSVRPCVTDIYLLLHGLHTLQRQHALLLLRRSHLKGEILETCGCNVVSPDLRDGLECTGSAQFFSTFGDGLSGVHGRPRCALHTFLDLLPDVGTTHLLETLWSTCQHNTVSEVKYTVTFTETTFEAMDFWNGDIKETRAATIKWLIKWLSTLKSNYFANRLTFFSF